MSKAIKIGAISFQTSKLVEEVFKPLRRFGVSYFSYTRALKDGTRIDINNQPAMSEFYYIDTKMYKRSAIEADPSNLNNGILLWSAFADDEAILMAKEDFNTGNGITLIENGVNFCELWHFASTNDNKMIVNFFLNNLNILKLFTFHFKEKFHHIIESASKKEITIISNDLVEAPSSNIILNPDEADIAEYESLLDIKRYYLNGKHDGIYLTKKEVACLRWCALGKTSEEIGQLLESSSRTVDVHLNNIKNKLGCFKQTHLTKKSIELGFIK